MKNLILILVMLSTLSLTNCSYFRGKKTHKINSNTEQTVTTVDPCDQKLAKLQAERDALLQSNANLRVDSASLKEKIECLESKMENVRIIAVTRNRPSNTGNRPAKRTITKTQSRASVTTGDNEEVINPTPITRPNAQVTRNNAGSKANLDYLRQDGKIIFCVRANSREDCYSPHLAIMQGITFTNSQDNHIKGYNWQVEPTNTYSGDYGVTIDGTFYVSDALEQTTMSAAGMTLEGLEIKCPYTGWALKTMTLQNGYWIYRTR